MKTVNYWMSDYQFTWLSMAALHGRCGRVSFNLARGWIGPWHQWAVLHPRRFQDWRALRRSYVLNTVQK